MAKKKKKSESKVNEQLTELVEETVDKVSEILDDFYEKAGQIVTSASDNEKVEEIVGKIKKIRKDIADGTADLVKNVARTISDTGEAITKLLKRKDDEDDD